MFCLHSSVVMSSFICSRLLCSFSNPLLHSSHFTNLKYEINAHFHFHSIQICRYCHYICAHNLNKTKMLHITHSQTHTVVQALDPISYAIIIICEFCRIVCLMLLLDKRWFQFVKFFSLFFIFHFFFAEPFPSRLVDLYLFIHCQFLSERLHADNLFE